MSFLTTLEQTPEQSNVVLDLSEVPMAFAGFMAPAIATIRHLYTRGWNFDLVLPENPLVAEYFEKAGWLAALEGRNPPPTYVGATYMPLKEYATSEELNPIIREVVDHFANVSTFGSGVLEAIEWMVNEIADNVLIHAGGSTGWIQLIKQPRKQLMEVVIVDTGRGITDSLRERYPELEDDCQAIELAVEKGVTRNPEVGQGNGLAGSFRIAVAAKGWVNIHSGNGSLRYLSSPRQTHITSAPLHQGTLVSLSVPMGRDIDLSGALWGHKPTPVAFEMKYLSEDSRGITFSVKNEASGFGNRPSGLMVRRRLENIMTMYPGEVVYLDFKDVDLVSASFADEFVARLAKRLGVTTFMSRVRITNTTEFVRRTLDEVIAQRLSG